MNIVYHFIFLIISLSCPFLCTQVKLVNGSLISPVVNHERGGKFSFGAIFDETSRSGKEARVAIEMVIHDFNLIGNQNLLLHFRNTQGNPVRAALAAKDLISTCGVNAILGAHTWDEASAIAEAARDEVHDQVPLFLSFADSVPTTPTFPWVLQVTPSRQVQMNAIAAIIQSWGSPQVTLICENAPTLSSPELFVSQLSQALQQSGAEVSRVFTIASFSLNLLQKELNQLKKEKHGVFVIHTTFGSGYCLYQEAKKLNMTGEGYAWIATHSITDLFHSVSPKKLSSMKAIIGTKTYFPENWREFHDFRKRFRSNFRTIYPDEEFDEPGIFASQAYDVIQALLFRPNIQNLFQRISAEYPGAKYQSIKWKVAPAKLVEIVNVIGKTYQSGYWTKGLGFSESIDDKSFYHNSIDILKEVLWPAQPWHTERRRRILSGRSEPIRVGVPAQSLFGQFVKVETDPKTNVTFYDGFSLKVFEEAMKIADINNDLTYNYFSFEGEYEDMVKQIALGNFNAIAADLTIVEERHKYADFSQAYTESGMVLIVPIRSRLPVQWWLFMKPFTKELWGLILAITIYNGFIVWLIERNHNPDFRSGTVWNQIGTLFSLAFTTLFTLSADKMHSNLSRIVMVVWLFVALLLTQSYTAILSSMLTAQRLAPATKDVATLKKMNATVGYCRGSFLKSYMIDALGFDSANIKKYSSTRAYAKALNTGEIAGIFLEVPAAKVFLAQYCKSFMKTEKTFKVGGYGFAFEKDFPMLPGINKAIMKLTENGKLLELEDRYINSEECVDLDLLSNQDASLGLDSFAGLFVITGCTSTVALAIYVIRYIVYSLCSTPERCNLLKRISAFNKKWRNKRQSSAIVIVVENPGNPPDASYSEARQHILQYNN